MMKRISRGAQTGVAMTLVLGMWAVLTPGCGTIDVNGFLGLENCDIFNCDGLFFRSLADDHDAMAGMADEDEHMDDVADHEDVDDMEEMDGHNEEEGEEHEEEAEGHEEEVEEHEGAEGGGSGIGGS